jgi:hypothetical protein
MVVHVISLAQPISAQHPLKCTEPAIQLCVSGSIALTMQRRLAEAWQLRYNDERFSMALRGHTASENNKPLRDSLR